MFQHFNNAVEPYELSNRNSKTYEDNIIFYNNIINYNEHIPVNNVGENEIKFYKSPFPKEKKKHLNKLSIMLLKQSHLKQR